MEWVLLAAIVGILAYANTLRATPSSGFMGATLAMARFDEIDVRNRYPTRHPSWHAKLTTRGDSDVFVQSNVWAPDGSTGWHTRPGPSLILVTAGTISGYEGDDPSCTPHVYTQGMGFVDRGGDHVHLLRNENPTVEARTIAVQLIPAESHEAD